MAEREFTGRVEPLTKGLVTAVEKQALAGETIPDEIKRRYVATVGHELLVKKPVDTETRPEPEVTEADMTAMRIDLGEAPKVVVESVGQPEDEMRSAKSIAEDILLATTGREKSERDGQGEQRNEAIRRLRDEKVNMNYLFGNDLDRITQKEERLKRREGLQQLARDLVTGEIGVEQRKVLVNRLRIKKPSDVNVVGAGRATAETGTRRVPADTETEADNEAAKELKLRKSVAEKIKVIDGYDNPKLRSKLTAKLAEQLANQGAPADLVNSLTHKSDADSPLERGRILEIEDDDQRELLRGVLIEKVAGANLGSNVDTIFNLVQNDYRTIKGLTQFGVFSGGSC